MTPTLHEVAIGHRFLKVGEDVYPILGKEGRGWNLDAGDLATTAPLLYDSIDELFFALVNFRFNDEGQA